MMEKKFGWRRDTLSAAPDAAGPVSPADKPKDTLSAAPDAPGPISPADKPKDAPAAEPGKTPAPTTSTSTSKP